MLTLIESFLKGFCSVLTEKGPQMGTPVVPLAAAGTGICMFTSNGQAHHTQCSLLAVSLVELLFCRTAGLFFLQVKIYI